MTRFALRALTLNHWFSAAKFLLEAFPEYSQKHVSALLRQDHLHGLLLFEGRTLSGLVFSYPMKQPRQIWVHSVAVHSNCRGMGWGKRLLTASEEYWQSLGAEVILARSLQNNQASRRMFLGAGYSPVDMEYEHWQDILYKPLTLPPDSKPLEWQAGQPSSLWKRRWRKLFYLLWVQRRLNSSTPLHS